MVCRSHIAEVTVVARNPRDAPVQHTTVRIPRSPHAAAELVEFFGAPWLGEQPYGGHAYRAPKPSFLAKRLILRLSSASWVLTPPRLTYTPRLVDDYLVVSSPAAAIWSNNVEC